MKISYQWLTDYVDLSVSVEEIEEALTLIGFEVEGVEKKGVPPLDKVVVGEVVDRQPHPDADRLSVCQVRVAEGEEPVGIVCGATNFQVGDRVPVALPGAVLPGNFKIKKSKLRGVPSAGMMCSARELNLGDDHGGLLILRDRPALGTPVHTLFPEPDVVFDIEVTPNRPDCLSFLGIARELAAFFERELTYPEIRNAVRGDPEEDAFPGKVEVAEPSACPRYTAWSVRGVKVKESPDWLKARLTSVGLRPVNNVVDITNFVLMETGQPLHAFDRAKIRGDRLRIRRANSGEKITTLDDKERSLLESDLVIADGERPLVIAGIMGSVDAEVDDSTEDLVLEAAYFEPSGIRASSRRLGLSTDSSYRFERGVDPTGIEYAASRCIDLIVELTGGEAVGVPTVVGHLPELQSEIAIHPEYVVRRIGFDVDEETIADAWSRLELEVIRGEGKDEPWTVRIPSYRGDLNRPIDLVEEFLRMYGTHRIPGAEVRGGALSSLGESPADRVARAFRSHFVPLGFHEAYSYSLRPAEDIVLWESAAAADLLALENPLARDQTHLRGSLLGGLLDVLRYNLGRGRKEFRFFECGRVFRENDGKIHEALSVAFAVTGPAESVFWMERERFDFHSARRLLQDLVELAGFTWSDVSLQVREGDRAWADKRSATAGTEENEGYFLQWGGVSREALRHHDLEQPVFAGELIFDPAKHPPVPARVRFHPVSPYPRVIKDISVVVPATVMAGDVRRKLEAHASATVSGFHMDGVEVFDVYEGEGIEAGRKSLAFTIAYSSPDRTLNEKEVGEAFDGLQSRIKDDPELEMRE